MSDDDLYIIRHTCRYEPPERRIFPCQGCAEECMRCEFHQPTDADGNDLGGENIDNCPDTPTHTDKSGRYLMCDRHAAYYRRYMGEPRLLHNESGPCQVCVELGRAGMDPTGVIPCSVCLPTTLCQSCGLPMGPFACETCDGDD